MIATFNRFEIEMTMKQAKSASHQGECIEDVKELLKNKKIISQLNKIGMVKIREELKEYGAWTDMELVDTVSNNQRIIWIAAGNIVEENKR